MKRWQRMLLSGLAGVISVIGAAVAQTPAADTGTALVIKGAVNQEVRLTLADLKGMSRSKVAAADHDGAVHEYEGVMLPAVLTKAGVPQGGDLRGKNLTLCVSGEKVIVVYTADGKQLGTQQGPLRLVVPGDKRQGRWVRMLKSITVVKAGE